MIYNNKAIIKSFHKLQIQIRLVLRLEKSKLKRWRYSESKNTLLRSSKKSNSKLKKYRQLKN